LFDEANQYVWLGSTLNSGYTIQPITQTVANTNGVELMMQAGTGLGSGLGGSLTISAGTAGATGLSGGLLTLLGGTGNGGVGGNVDIVSGNGSAANSSGQVSIVTNSPTGSGGSGQIFVRTGAVASTSGTNSTGTWTGGSGSTAATASIGGTGAVILESGLGRNTGNVTVRSGSVANGGGIAGIVKIIGGDSTNGGGTPGNIEITAGNGPSSTRGTVTITGNVAVNGVTFSAGAVPYYIAVSTTFTIAEYFQALFHMDIEIDGDIAIDGYLIEV
jgi:hypothetical protein